MGKTVLFSPVGGTDPISLSNLRDGSMLHICRYYKPDKVILYMSKEIVTNHNKDDRYRFCIRKLARMQNRNIEIELIEKPELENVQEFDYFYDEFLAIIRNISSQLGEDDTLLVNISSGTPAMKSGLLVLITLGEFPCKAIQVVTPMRSMNEHTHKGFDLETVWELNEDNENDENRCKEVRCPALSMIKNEEILKKHILAYDYAAANRMAEEMPANRVKDYHLLIKLANARLNLDNNAIGRLSPNNTHKFFPIWSMDERKIFEYALSIDIKRRRGEYADFIRAFTPLFAEMLERILLKTCKVDLEKYCKVYRNGSKKWNRDALLNSDVIRYLEEEFPDFRDRGPVYSVHIIALIERISSDSKLNDLIHKLRSVEEKIRNVAAHQVTSITDEKIKSETGYTGQQMMNLIKQLFQYTGINVKSEYWDSYNDMNQKIIAKI